MDEFEHIEENKSQSSQKFFKVGGKDPQGPSSINLQEMLISDYIPKVKRSESSKTLRFKKSHAMPLIPTSKSLDQSKLGTASNADKILQNPKKFMQPKFAISLHV